MFPVWSRNGRELFYVRDDTMMQVDVETEARFVTGMPVPLFKCPVEVATPPTRHFDILPDGRFVMVARADGAERAEICVIADF
jgi:hypothetical protein